MNMKKKKNICKIYRETLGILNLSVLHNLLLLGSLCNNVYDLEITIAYYNPIKSFILLLALTHTHPYEIAACYCHIALNNNGNPLYLK